MIEFLGYDKPFLKKFSEILLNKYLEKDILDLSELIICLPGQKSIRRLQEIIFENNQNISIILPRFCTPGELPDHLIGIKDYGLRKSQRLNIWIRAIKKLENSDLVSLISYQDVNYINLFGIAKSIDQIYLELVGSEKNFEDLLQVVSNHILESNLNDWVLLQKIYHNYLEIIDKENIIDQHQLRLTEEVINCNLILASCIDLNKISKKIIKNITNKHIYVNSIEENSALYDEFGCFIPEKFKNYKLKDINYQILSSEYDYSKFLLAELNETKYKNQEITIFNCNEEINNLITEQAKSSNLILRPTHGNKAINGYFGKFINSLKNFIENKNFISFGELIRHPIINNYYKIDLKEWDKIQNNHIQEKFIEHKLDVLEDFNQEFIKNLLLINNNKNSFEYNINILESIVPNLSSLEESEQIYNIFSNINDIIAEENIDFYQFINLIIIILNETYEDNEKILDSIDLLGWLEMPLDDSKQAYLLGMNDEYVPGVKSQDFYLPDSIKSEIGLPDSEYKTLRDLAILSNKVYSSNLKILLAKKNISGESLLPSRILYFSEDQFLIRLLDDFTNHSKIISYIPENDNSTVEKLKEKIEISNLKYLRVTDFKLIKNNPIRFYYREYLDNITDEKEILDPLDIGNILHKIFEKIVRAEINNKQFDIKKDSLNIANLYINEIFNNNINNNIIIQLEILNQHIVNWIEWQVRVRKSKIETIEIEKSYEHLFKTNVGDITVKARIDRVDIDKIKKIIYVIDYKFKDKKDDLAPFSKGDWRDFQLPLYWMILKEHYPEFEIKPLLIKIGREYSNIPDLDTLESNKEEELAIGVEQAREIAEKAILGIQFKPEKIRELDWFGYLYNRVIYD